MNIVIEEQPYKPNFNNTVSYGLKWQYKSKEGYKKNSYLAFQKQSKC